MKEISDSLQRLKHSERHAIALPARSLAERRVDEEIIRAGPAALDHRKAIHVIPHKPIDPNTATLSQPEHTILRTLEQLRLMGIDAPSKTQVALWAGVSPKSGSYFNNLSRLRSAGMIIYLNNGQMSLSEAGRKRVGSIDIEMDITRMQDDLKRRVGASRGRLLEILIQRYPDPIPKPLLAEEANVSPTSGGYFNNLSFLRSMGLIDYTPEGVKAQPVLFSEA